MQYRVGVVNFLNAFPLWAALEKKAETQLFLDTPSRLAARLQRGELDVALISSVEFLRQPQGFAYHPGLCIAAVKESKSIRLFTATDNLPIQDALRSINCIYTDAASRSSVAQLRVILHKLGVAPQLEEVFAISERIAKLDSGEGALAIGDTALRCLNAPSYDLQTAYYEIFQRGFVYALWVGRSGIMPDLEPIFDAAHQDWVLQREALLAAAAQRYGFALDFTRAYLSNTIQYLLTAQRASDLDFFGQMWQRLPNAFRLHSH